ncbi:MAG: hypothetical protein R3C53_15455 [Pirellulaceae bacterium]
MPKALCLIGLVLAILVLLIFLLDLVLGLAGMVQAAPLKYASMSMDIVFVLGSGMLAYAAWITFREQR